MVMQNIEGEVTELEFVILFSLFTFAFLAWTPEKYTAINMEHKIILESLISNLHFHSLPSG